MKYIFTIILSAAFIMGKAQKVDSIFVNLYTDSLKLGTFNYINVDGLMSNGVYLPMDTNHVKFHASAGKFVGNSLWLDKEFKPKSVDITVCLKTDIKQTYHFTMFVKLKPDNERLRTSEEIIESIKEERRNSKTKKG